MASKTKRPQKKREAKRSATMTAEATEAGETVEIPEKQSRIARNTKPPYKAAGWNYRRIDRLGKVTTETKEVEAEA